MPYEIRKGHDGRWHVYNQDTGEDKGSSDDKEHALAHMRVLYAIESDPEAFKTRKRKGW
jgi:hypothetical protein